jgi:hypothetical protein
MSLIQKKRIMSGYLFVFIITLGLKAVGFSLISNEAMFLKYTFFLLLTVPRRYPLLQKGMYLYKRHVYNYWSFVHHIISISRPITTCDATNFNSFAHAYSCSEKV